MFGWRRKIRGARDQIREVLLSLSDATTAAAVEFAKA
jgi:hypothetical protein